MQTVAIRFDPEQYKRTTYSQWQDAAAAWHRCYVHFMRRTRDPL